MDVEFPQDILMAGLYSIGSNIQTGGNFAVGESQAGQRGDILFARGEGAPFAP